MMLLNPYRFGGGGGGGGAPVVGDYWAGQGGYYAGTITYPDARKFHLVVAAKAADVSTLAWKVDATSTGAASSAFDGWANTQAIEAAGLSSHPAAQQCRAHTADGHADFYLPAASEMSVVYAALGPNLGGTPAAFKAGGAQAFTADDYWLSRNTPDLWAWVITMGNGSTRDNAYKTWAFSSLRTRPVRRVAVE